MTLEVQCCFETLGHLFIAVLPVLRHQKQDPLAQHALTVAERQNFGILFRSRDRLEGSPVRCRDRGEYDQEADSVEKQRVAGAESGVLI